MKQYPNITEDKSHPGEYRGIGLHGSWYDIIFDPEIGTWGALNRTEHDADPRYVSAKTLEELSALLAYTSWWDRREGEGPGTPLNAGPSAQREKKELPLGKLITKLEKPIRP